MPNENIPNAEIIHLRTGILKKYCQLVGYKYPQFERDLTSTISIYEKIYDVIIDYLDDRSNFVKYSKLLKAGPFKVRLKKIMESVNSEMETKRFLDTVKSSLSAQTLRKLLFYGPKEEELSFREDFITGCYIYLNTERSSFSAGLGTKTGTVDIFDKNPLVSGKGTVDSFNHTAAFTLQSLTADNEVDASQKKLVFKGNKSQLNRDNLDSGNLTITSKVQAEITFINGEWIVENKSQLKSTFIRVDKPTRIKKGDVIIFGNKRYLFED